MGPGGSDGDDLTRAAERDVLDRATDQLQTGRVEVVGPGPDPVRSGEGGIETGGERLAGEEDQVRALVDAFEVGRCVDDRGHDLDAGRARQRQRLDDVVLAPL